MCDEGRGRVLYVGMHKCCSSPGCCFDALLPELELASCHACMDCFAGTRALRMAGPCTCGCTELDSRPGE